MCLHRRKMSDSWRILKSNLTINYLRPNTWNDILKLQQIMCQYIIAHPCYSLSENLEKKLWEILFEKHILLFMEKLEICNQKEFNIYLCNYNFFLDIGFGFYLMMLQKLLKNYDIEFSFCKKNSFYGNIDVQGHKNSLIETDELYYLCYVCVFSLGKVCDYKGNLDQAIDLYKKAYYMLPINGLPYYSIAQNLAKTKDDKVDIYLYVRAAGTLIPEPKACEQLSSSETQKEIANLFIKNQLMLKFEIYPPKMETLDDDSFHFNVEESCLKNFAIILYYHHKHIVLNESIMVENIQHVLDEFLVEAINKITTISNWTSTPFLWVIYLWFKYIKNTKNPKPQTDAKNEKLHIALHYLASTLHNDMLTNTKWLDIQADLSFMYSAKLLNVIKHKSLLPEEVLMWGFVPLLNFEIIEAHVASHRFMEDKLKHIRCPIPHIWEQVKTPKTLESFVRAGRILKLFQEIYGEIDFELANQYVHDENLPDKAMNEVVHCETKISQDENKAKVDKFLNNSILFSKWKRPENVKNLDGKPTEAIKRIILKNKADLVKQNLSHKQVIPFQDGVRDLLSGKESSKISNKVLESCIESALYPVKTLPIERRYSKGELTSFSYESPKLNEDNDSIATPHKFYQGMGLKQAVSGVVPLRLPLANRPTLSARSGFYPPYNPPSQNGTPLLQPRYTANNRPPLFYRAPQPGPIFHNNFGYTIPLNNLFTPQTTAITNLNTQNYWSPNSEDINYYDNNNNFDKFLSFMNNPVSTMVQPTFVNLSPSPQRLECQTVNYPDADCVGHNKINNISSPDMINNQLFNEPDDQSTFADNMIDAVFARASPASTDLRNRSNVKDGRFDPQNLMFDSTSTMPNSFPLSNYLDKNVWSSGMNEGINLDNATDLSDVFQNMEIGGLDSTIGTDTFSAITTNSSAPFNLNKLFSAPNYPATASMFDDFLTMDFGNPIGNFVVKNSGNTSENLNIVTNAGNVSQELAKTPAKPSMIGMTKFNVFAPAFNPTVGSKLSEPKKMEEKSQSNFLVDMNDGKK